jgi:uncharacterized protein (DUF2147 family)
MMKKIGAFVGVVVLLCLPGRVLAQNPDAILGKWLNAKGTAQVEIYKADGKYFGKIVWLKEPVYPPDDPEGMAGKTKVDRHNPDPARRTQPLLNLVLLRGFDFSSGVLWEHGMIYDPENGKDYRCKVTLTSPDVLRVRGFIGISLFGRTEIWTKVK